MRALNELHAAAVRVGRASPEGPQNPSKYLRRLDYSVLQQCIHCGMCLPTCPTYEETKLERNSPRGRIALMRQIADGQLEVTHAFGEELYFCLGCLACETACPAGVRYGEMFEFARADIEQAGVKRNPIRDGVRALTLRWLFTRPEALRILGRLIWLFQASGLDRLARKLKLTRLLPVRLRRLEPLTPRVQRRFSDSLIKPLETPADRKFRVALLTGCMQDLTFSHVNRDTVDVLLANGCEVITPRAQVCCGSLHAHNGELELAKQMARRTLDAFDLDHLDAVVTNAAGCGTHLKNYGHLLHDDPVYAQRASQWSAKMRDIHEWLAEIGIRVPAVSISQKVTYHQACHLCHGQKITEQPRQVLKAIPGLELVELPESSWCCGSAGIYNITQPDMSEKLLQRKLANIEKTGVNIVASANPGCSVQLEAGARFSNKNLKIVHPISLLAQGALFTRRDPDSR
jgi:glycolate oxidase iron-sulfur subunit